MPCYSPLQAWRGKGVGASGKVPIVWRRPRVLRPVELNLPCGQCVGCRLERSRQWAVRCVHESELYERNCFITLTYDNEHLPANGSVDVREFQLFMKRLRKRFGEGIRFFHCGEYGENLGRPHYHACLFNFDFDDKEVWSVRNGNRLYRSASLDSVWGLGHAVVGDVTFESAAYVARYIMKKVTGDVASSHYDGRRPEYITMSRRPGIGKGWFDRFRSDVYPGDSVVVRGSKMKPPKYYDNLYEMDFPDEMKLLKGKREYRGLIANRWKDVSGGIRESEGSLSRLRVKEKVKVAAISSLSRSLEVGHVE